MFSEGGKGLQNDKPLWFMPHQIVKDDAHMGGLMSSVWIAIRKRKNESMIGALRVRHRPRRSLPLFV